MQEAMAKQLYADFAARYPATAPILAAITAARG